MNLNGLKAGGGGASDVHFQAITDVKDGTGGQTERFGGVVENDGRWLGKTYFE